MAQTTVPFGDPKAAKKWSAGLAVDFNRSSYFSRKFIASDGNSVIQKKNELETDSGDTVSFDLSVQLRGEPVYGDNRARGHEESLRFYTDTVIIDQFRKPVSGGGKMTRKRTVHDLRKVARDRLGDYLPAFIDELIFIYLSGARGVNADYIVGTGWTGHAGNALQTPDANHNMFGGSATSDATITSTDVMSKALIERAAVRAEMSRAIDNSAANMMPVRIGGEDHYVCVMSPYQAYNLRSSTTAGDWLDIQKAAATAEGAKNAIFAGSLGMVNNVILHSHSKVVRFSNWGTGSNLPGARALFLGRQAGILAFGGKSGMSFDWAEELQDYGNEPGIAGGAIFGFKKARFNGNDFGVIALDTYAVNPN
jgi:N4-gp56 family major capsid protein